MFCHRLTYLRRAKTVFAPPLNSDSRSRAISLNLCAAVRLEHFPPREIELSVVVPDVHHLFATEFFPDSRIDLGKHPSTIRKRRVASLARRLDTEETDDHRPLP